MLEGVIIWFTAGVAGWFLAMRQGGWDHVTVGDFLILPVVACFGPFAIILAALHKQ